jgi:hypothetical protein
MKYQNTNPNPAALLSSLRDIGYNIETAIEDLIDNSITAKAIKIEIRMIWNKGDPWMAILDNGRGMSNSELVKAMTLAGNNPLETRHKDDLGRFGLGLKTASFSQCKQLTVITFNNNSLSAAEIDLEEVNTNIDKGFRVGILEDDDINTLSLSILDRQFPEFLASKKGTLVLWKKMDRIDHFDHIDTRQKKFTSMSSNVKERIQITFHRFMRQEKGSPKIEIIFNKDILSYFDPFNTKNSKTRELPEKILKLENKKILAQAYILPHHSVGDEEYKKYALSDGYFMNQGFYVYRNRRLIARGTWLRLTHRSELTKLVRIKIDIPNTLDDILRVNVMKSSLIFPETLKEQLSQVLDQITNAGIQVYRKRAQRVISEITEPMWIRTKKDGKIFYQINHDSRLISSLTNDLNDDQYDKFSILLKSLESCFPTMPFFNDLANNPNQLEKPKISEEELTRVINILKSDIQDELADIDLILKIEPFASNKDQTKKILNTMGLIK